MGESADVVVVGMGPGGDDLAGRLADAGLDVVGVDGRLLGGECPYWGCIPSKMMIRAGNMLAEAGRIAGIAGAASVTPSWDPVAARLRKATDNWDDRVAVERFEGRGGRFVRGWGKLDGPRRVVVGDRSFDVAKAIVLNPGTVPSIPPIPGLAGTPYWTNREAIECSSLPASLAVVGGGAIGCELGQVFGRFGSQVTVIEGAPRLIRPEEPESSDLVAAVFAREGIDVRVGAVVSAVSHDGDAFHIELDPGEPVVAERLLVATGRHADLRALGVATIGLDETARSIPVDGHMRVCEGVWAIGDVTGHGAFTHISMYEAGIACRDILGHELVPADYHALPRVTFTDPEVGSVGLTEEGARQKGLSVRTGYVPLSDVTRGYIHDGGNDGFIKVVEDASREVLVGATSAGPVGGEVLGHLALAVHADVPVDKLRRMIYAYPTFHRGIEAALTSLRH